MSLRRTGLILWLLAAGCSEAPAPSATPDRPAMGSNAVGERAFMRCRACHSTQAGDAHKVGPNLHGFMSRPAGAGADYQYSPELVSAGLNWDSATLAAWITDPAFTVPGTTMVYANDLSGDEIVALISYLKARTAFP